MTDLTEWGARPLKAYKTCPYGHRFLAPIHKKNVVCPFCGSQTYKQAS